MKTKMTAFVIVSWLACLAIKVTGQVASASHILLSSSDEATQVIGFLKAGTHDWDTLAKERSLCPTGAY